MHEKHIHENDREETSMREQQTDPSQSKTDSIPYAIDPLLQATSHGDTKTEETTSSSMTNSNVKRFLNEEGSFRKKLEKSLRSRNSGELVLLKKRISVDDLDVPRSGTDFKKHAISIGMSAAKYENDDNSKGRRGDMPRNIQPMFAGQMPYASSAASSPQSYMDDKHFRHHSKRNPLKNKRHKKISTSDIRGIVRASEHEIKDASAEHKSSDEGNSDNETSDFFTELTEHLGHSLYSELNFLLGEYKKKENNSVDIDASNGDVIISNESLITVSTVLNNLKQIKNQKDATLQATKKQIPKTSAISRENKRDDNANVDTSVNTNTNASVNTNTNASVSANTKESDSDSSSENENESNKYIPMERYRGQSKFLMEKPAICSGAKRLQKREAETQKHEVRLFQVLKAERASQLKPIIEETTVDVIMPFLPIITYTLSNPNNKNFENMFKNEMSTRACILSRKKAKKFRQEVGALLSERIVRHHDLHQSVQFLLASYKSKEKTPIALLYSGMAYTSEAAKPMITSSTGSTAVISTATIDKSSAGQPTTAIDSRDKAKENELHNNELIWSRSVCTARLPKDPVKFWEFIAYFKDAKAGFEFELDCESHKLLRDPCVCNSPPISRLSIRKVMNSHAKPFLIDIYTTEFSQPGVEIRSSTIILKAGDDLRKDAMVMQVFKFMNHIWHRSNLTFEDKHVNVLTYKVVPMSPNFGCIELVPGCIALRHISHLQNFMKAKHYNTLACSAAGSYIASFVMGIRDRHFDNILVRQTDCTLFHIDFNYVLGEKVSFDACPFGITHEFYDLMKEHYKNFVNLAVKAYQLLRDNYGEIAEFAQLAFDGIVPTDAVKKFIKEKLRIGESNEKAEQLFFLFYSFFFYFHLLLIYLYRWLRKQLNEAPFNKQTKWKNRIHKLATDLSGSEK
ncbi:phosphatidylinositol 3-kinase [Reticulomyxa filosa]|uniref:Phosphatidylinositol 3-kinase n=1 Tax=Reticulomyxa filosa TaxID=46433 RepID=X6NVE4_RETFI|nr:phosphatidylinositol 3-kinase [Reticulomyxa filosa]|eukprot:ETO29976.1 phosphatidylinositol 3-kinase [Reticulomyxa filosa]